MRIRALIVALLLCCAAMAQLPDAPRPNTWEGINGKPATLFSFRAASGDPPLRTNRQAMTSKRFLILHVALFASFVVDNRVTHGARERWHSELPAIVGVSGMDYLTSRYFTEASSVEAPLYGVQHYVRDVLK